MALAEKAKTALKTTVELSAILLTFPKDTSMTNGMLAAIADGSGASLGLIYGRGEELLILGNILKINISTTNREEDSKSNLKKPFALL